MGLQWRNFNEIKPEDGQRCLTKMKHGMIEGAYDAEDGTFRAYYWHDMCWYASDWIPSEEVERA
jgi:hypothetical protein